MRQIERLPLRKAWYRAMFKTSEEPKCSNKDEQAADLDGPDAVSYFSLFKGADAWDGLAIAFGVVGAVINGATFPLFSFYFGEVRSIAPLPCLLSRCVRDLHPGSASWTEQRCRSLTRCSLTTSRQKSEVPHWHSWLWAAFLWSCQSWKWGCSFGQVNACCFWCVYTRSNQSLSLTAPRPVV